MLNITLNKGSSEAADQQSPLVVDVALYRMRRPLLLLLQDHEDGIVRECLEEVLSVHAGAIFIQHQGTDTQDVQRVAHLRPQGHRNMFSKSLHIAPTWETDFNFWTKDRTNG